MKDSLILEGKIYISAKRAAKIINYAQDYIGQLCRSGKLDCKMIGRSWYVTEESLLNHREQAVDATQERILKVVKSITPENVTAVPVIEKKIEVVKETLPSILVTSAPVATTSTPSPFVSPLTAFKYEVENKPALPEITKKVPSTFSLPKKVSDLTSTPFAVKLSTKPKPMPQSQPKSAAIAISSTRTLAYTVIVVLVLVSGFMFTLAGKNIQKVAVGDVRAASITSNFFFGIFRTLGFGKPATLATIPRSSEISSSNLSAGSKFNGIGVVPSTGSISADEAAKQKIKTSFSDEVSIQPDESGTAGVITPVFKKGSGDDFMYVLVPVKEKNQ